MLAAVERQCGAVVVGRVGINPLAAIVCCGLIVSISVGTGIEYFDGFRKMCFGQIGAIVDGGRIFRRHL